MGFIWILTNRTFREREFPTLERSWKAFWIMIGLISLYAALIIGFLLLWNHPASIAALVPRFLLHLPSALRSPLIDALYGAVEITIIMLALVFWRLRSWRTMGFRLEWRDVGLTAALIGAAIALSAIKATLFAEPQTLALLTSLSWAGLVGLLPQTLVNGVPEETFDRGYLFPQLLAFLRKPWVAMWVMVIIFDASHIPLMIIHDHFPLAWWQYVLWSVFPSQPTGLVWGYLYWRCRTLIPGIALHTSYLWAPFL